MSPFQIFNQNSYTFTALFLFLVALAAVAARFRDMAVAWLGLIVLALILIAGDLLLRVGASEIESTAQFDQLLAAHQPVLLEIYSNY